MNVNWCKDSLDTRLANYPQSNICYGKNLYPVTDNSGATNRLRNALQKLDDQSQCFVDSAETCLDKNETANTITTNKGRHGFLPDSLIFFGSTIALGCKVSGEYEDSTLNESEETKIKTGTRFLRCCIDTKSQNFGSFSLDGKSKHEPGCTFQVVTTGGTANESMDGQLFYNTSCWFKNIATGKLIAMRVVRDIFNAHTGKRRDSIARVGILGLINDKARHNASCGKWNLVDPTINTRSRRSTVKLKPGYGKTKDKKQLKNRKPIGHLSKVRIEIGWSYLATVTRSYGIDTDASYENKNNRSHFISKHNGSNTEVIVRERRSMSHAPMKIHNFDNQNGKKGTYSNSNSNSSSSSKGKEEDIWTIHLVEKSEKTNLSTATKNQNKLLLKAVRQMNKNSSKNYRDKEGRYTFVKQLRINTDLMKQKHDIQTNLHVRDKCESFKQQIIMLNAHHSNSNENKQENQSIKNRVHSYSKPNRGDIAMPNQYQIIRHSQKKKNKPVKNTFIAYGAWSCSKNNESERIATKINSNIISDIIDKDSPKKVVRSNSSTSGSNVLPEVLLELNKDADITSNDDDASTNNTTNNNTSKINLHVSTGEALMPFSSLTSVDIENWAIRYRAESIMLNPPLMGNLTVSFGVYGRDHESKKEKPQLDCIERYNGDGNDVTKFHKILKEAITNDEEAEECTRTGDIYTTTTRTTARMIEQLNRRCGSVKHHKKHITGESRRRRTSHPEFRDLSSEIRKIKAKYYCKYDTDVPKPRRNKINKLQRYTRPRSASLI